MLLSFAIPAGTIAMFINSCDPPGLRTVSSNFPGSNHRSRLLRISPTFDFTARKDLTRAATTIELYANGRGGFANGTCATHSFTWTTTRRDTRRRMHSG